MAKEAVTYDEEFRRLVDGKRGYCGLKTMAKFAKAVQMADRTVARKLKNPEMFTLGELRRIYMVLHFDAAERDILNHIGWMK